MLAAVALVVAAAVHTASHLLNTIPMLVSETNLTVLNANTKCTICADNEVCCILLPRVLQYPTCPFDALPTYKEVLFKSFSSCYGISHAPQCAGIPSTRSSTCTP